MRLNASALEDSSVSLYKVVKRVSGVSGACGRQFNCREAASFLTAQFVVKVECFGTRAKHGRNVRAEDYWDKVIWFGVAYARVTGALDIAFAQNIP